jgi:prepilin-type N-terminal cleavage/methylation domain-containing protein
VSRRTRSAFTLVEAVVVLVIIAVLAGIALVAVGGALRTARNTAEQQFLRSCSVAITQFKNDFGFLPPLLDESAPVVGTDPNLPGNNDAQYQQILRREAGGLATDIRYSTYALPTYLLGVLPQRVDGKDGGGMTSVERDGTFTRRGKIYEPMVDVAKDRSRVNRISELQVQLVDRWGQPIRYYRWQPRLVASGDRKGEIDQYLVPRIAGDPNTNVALRGAEFALLSLGPDGRTDELGPLPTGGGSGAGTDGAPIDTLLTKDDIVEVGS